MATGGQGIAKQTPAPQALFVKNFTSALPTHEIGGGFQPATARFRGVIRPQNGCINPKIARDFLPISSVRRAHGEYFHQFRIILPCQTPCKSAKRGAP
jgi:hypothetical protein